ncbi:hypothetical protein ONZ51_g36 [Trametes cubensis]|uniref:Uncharacterized protein n=1 Tax=Trametes cubensis TaxID=1111947 RepID=A0AAD7U6J9_9APHY|nr:hypothetical protein ONZ51_g36 [Trametes cubensis]
MPHTLAAVQFDPAASAYWLPRSGQLTAAKIPTTQFWAIRFHIDDSGEGDNCPNQSSVIRHAGDEDQDLTLDVPLPCANDETVCRPMYVHTAPVLRIHMFRSPPVKRVFCQFDEESLRRFKKTVRENRAALRTHWLSRQKEEWARRIAQWDDHSLPDLNTTFSEQAIDPTYMFSYLNNPQAYCFKFIYDGTACAIEKRPKIYEEMLLYAQICKDYRWKGVERTLLWIRASRKGGDDNCQREAEPLADDDERDDATKLFKRDSAVRQVAKGLRRFGFRSISVEEEEQRDASTSPTSSSDSSTTHSDDSEYTLIYRRDFAFPELAWKYPEIPLGAPRMVIFDAFGVVFTIEDIIALYIEIEALAAGKGPSIATSFATIVHSALQTLALKLAIPPQARPALIANAAASGIMKPIPYFDVELALEALSRQGLPVLVIPPHSEVTMRHLVSSLPRRNKVHPTNEPLSIHFAATPSFFKSLLAQCRSMVPHIEPKDVLLVSTSVGRVVAPASLAGHPTVLLKRHGMIASKVRFVVGHLPHTNPVPSLVVGGLMELCTKIWR